MNDEQERHEGEDPVADFFARERASIRPEPADDLRWQRIVREARRDRSSRWLATVGGVAAAGVVAATLAFGPQVADTLRGQQQQGPVAPASQSAGRSGAPSPNVLRSTGNATGTPSTPVAPSSTTTTQPKPAPGSFVAGSVSNSGQKRLFLLGSSRCGGERCPVLQTSSDNGQTWHVVHSFPARDSDLTQVRFANPDVGWVYGTHTIQVTRDGGRTWSDYGFPGDTVFDLESNGRDVIVTSSTQCASGTCAGHLTVSVTPIGGTAATQTAIGVDGLRRADISTSRQHTVIVPRWPAGSKVRGGPWTLEGSDLVEAAQTAGAPQSRQCDSTSTGTLVVGANDPGRLVSLCPGDTPGTFVVQSSDDGAISWTSLGDTLSLPGDGPVSLAAASRSHLLAARGDTLLVITDAGASWHAPAGPPPTPQQGWVWVGAPGGTQFYALTGDGSGYWVSSDWGEHWTEVTPQP
jgi:hypothetical protein